MNEKQREQLYDLLMDFATLPCQSTEKEFSCDGCQINEYCSMLYSLSRGLKGEINLEKVVDSINADYLNTKQLEEDRYIKWREDEDKYLDY